MNNLKMFKLRGKRVGGMAFCTQRLDLEPLLQYCM